ncbi:MAG: phospholipase D family protein [Chitinophagales bacterium]|nr:phospholipase D family protein [Chitinophagales bacterium]
MNIKILGQGFEHESANAVGHYLIKFLGDKAFHTFTGITAFASLAGVKGLSSHIEMARDHLAKITIVTGVDQKGTSKEALEALLALGIDAYIFYQPSVTIFHPKIYLFEGNDRCELIIGSSNLTSQGLFTNIETSLHLSLNRSSDTHWSIVEQLKAYFKGIFDLSDPNLKKISKDIIDDLVKAKIVPTEDERKAAQDKMDKPEKHEAVDFILKIFPKRLTAKVPPEFRGRGTRSTVVSPKALSRKGTPRKEALVWESKNLTERDLNIPSASNTNPTGSMLFKKGQMQGIDQRHHFREVVFSKLKWEKDATSKHPHLERAVATFYITIDGKSKGTFDLVLTHNSDTGSRSYQQKNSMTQVSWGFAKEHIAKPELIGKQARLYKTRKNNVFVLEIN